MHSMFSYMMIKKLLSEFAKKYVRKVLLFHIYTSYACFYNTYKVAMHL